MAEKLSEKLACTVVNESNLGLDFSPLTVLHSNRSVLSSGRPPLLPVMMSSVLMLNLLHHSAALDTMH